MLNRLYTFIAYSSKLTSIPAISTTTYISPYIIGHYSSKHKLKTTLREVLLPVLLEVFS